MVYVIDFDIASVIISIFVIFYIFNKKGLKQTSNRLFLVLILVNLITAVADITSSVLNSYPDLGALWKQDVLNYLYLAAHNSVPTLLLFYILSLLRFPFSRKKFADALICLPLMVDFALLFMNQKCRFIFYYDEKGTYLHGPLFFILYLIAFMYMAAVLFVIFKRRKSIAASKLIALVIYIVLSVASLVIQMFLPKILLEIFAQTLGLMGVLFSIENQDDIIDRVTNVYNRYAFYETAPGILGRKDYAYISVNLPELAYYHTTIGIENTSAAVKELASFLKRSFKEMQCFDTGRGHFVLLGRKKDLTAESKNIITDAFDRVWGKGNVKIKFPGRICMGTVTDSPVTMEELLLISDSGSEGSETTFLDAEYIINKHKRHILIERLISDALENDGFEVYYQPIYDRKSGLFHSAEALIRLKNTQYGYISPEEFIPIAEENGSIGEIGERVFENVCRFFSEARLDEKGIEYIEVNLSTLQCMDPDLAKKFGKILGRYSISPEKINLEITESAATGNYMTLKDNVEKLKSMGFTFSLDDYGTGYSNYSYMFELPFKIIKLDKSILWQAYHPKNGAGEENLIILLESTVLMMKKMGYVVLCEGVETVEQKMALEKLGCDCFQGYYFSKPVAKEVFLDFIKVVNL